MSKNTFMYVLLLSEIIGLVVSHSYLALVFALAENFNSVFCTSQYYWGSVISTSSCLIIIDWRQNILCTMYIFPLSCLVPISKIKVYVSINFLSNVEYVLDFYQVPLWSHHNTTKNVCIYWFLQFSYTVKQGVSQMRMRWCLVIQNIPYNKLMVIWYQRQLTVIQRLRPSTATDRWSSAVHTWTNSSLLLRGCKVCLCVPLNLALAI